MLADPASRTFRLLLLSTAFIAFGPAPDSSWAAGPDQGTSITLADMVGQAEVQAQQSNATLERLQPLETVGAKGGVPQSLVSDRSELVTPSESALVPVITGLKSTASPATEPEAAGQVAAESESSEGLEPFMERLSRIMADMSAELAGGIVRPEAAQQRDPDPAVQPPLVLDELVGRPHANSLAEGADRGNEADASAAVTVQAIEDETEQALVPAVPEATSREFMPVVAAPETAPDSVVNEEAGAEKVAVAPAARDNTIQFQATGLTLADMAMEVTPAPPKQAVPSLAPAAVPLARLVVPHAGSAPALRPTLRQTALTSPRFVLPGARVAPRTKPRLALRFPDPRSIDSGFGDDPGNEALQYPASASLAQFLGGIERMPVPTRGRAIMPVNLEQIARQARGTRAAATRLRRPAPGFSFSFSGESFAGNRLTGQNTKNPALGGSGRRQALMDELRQVFTPVR